MSAVVFRFLWPMQVTCRVTSWKKAGPPLGAFFDSRLGLYANSDFVEAFRQIVLQMVRDRQDISNYPPTAAI